MLSLRAGWVALRPLFLLPFLLLGGGRVVWREDVLEKLIDVFLVHLFIGWGVVRPCLLAMCTLLRGGRLVLYFRALAWPGMLRLSSSDLVAHTVAALLYYDNKIANRKLTKHFYCLYELMQHSETNCCCVDAIFSLRSCLALASSYCSRFLRCFS